MAWGSLWTSVDHNLLTSPSPPPLSKLPSAQISPNHVAFNNSVFPTLVIVVWMYFNGCLPPFSFSPLFPQRTWSRKWEFHVLCDGQMRQEALAVKNAKMLTCTGLIESEDQFHLPPWSKQRSDLLNQDDVSISLRIGIVKSSLYEFRLITFLQKSFQRVFAGFHNKKWTITVQR